MSLLSFYHFSRKDKIIANRNKIPWHPNSLSSLTYFHTRGRDIHCNMAEFKVTRLSAISLGLVAKLPKMINHVKFKTVPPVSVRHRFLLSCHFTNFNPKKVIVYILQLALYISYHWLQSFNIMAGKECGV